MVCVGGVRDWGADLQNVCVCVCWCVGGGGIRAVLESWTGPGGHCGWLPLTDSVTVGKSLPLSDLSCANL